MSIKCEDKQLVGALLRDFATDVKEWQDDFKLRPGATHEVESSVLDVAKSVYDQAKTVLEGKTSPGETRAKALADVLSLTTILKLFSIKQARDLCQNAQDLAATWGDKDRLTSLRSCAGTVVVDDASVKLLHDRVAETQSLSKDRLAQTPG